jgi:hypothetical protein
VPPRFRFEVDPTHVSFKSAGDILHDAAITRQAVALLRTTFAMPVGHPMQIALVDRKLISLSAPDGSQAVAVGLELGPDPTATERPRQIVNVITAGKDFAVAVSRDYILSLLRPQLDALEATTTTVEVGFLFLTAKYTVKITSATVQWGLDTISSGGMTMPCGALDLTINGKGETTSAAPDGTFTIRHRILLGFNPAVQSLFLQPKGGAAVSADFGGIGLIENVIEDEIASNYNTQMTSALAAAGPQVAVISRFRDFLASQLRMSDEHAAVTLDAAEFVMDGLLLRGKVSLTPRSRPVVQFGPLPDASGYGAFRSWFPGGRITEFGWQWQLTTPELLASPPAQQRQHADRFVVQPAVEMPGLPPPSGGLFHAGRVCLGLKGLVIDPVTGAEVPAVAGSCVAVDVSAPGFLSDIASGSLRWRLGTDVEMGVVEAGGGGVDAQPFNILLYHAGASSASLDAVIESIDNAAQDDAGLLVLMLVAEGGLDETAAARLRDAAPQHEATVRVIEDVSAEWARAFGVSDYEAFRLITAEGVLAWSHDGAIDAQALSAALREHLVPSPSPQLLPLRPDAIIGRRAPHAYLDPPLGERLSLAQLRGRPVTLCFALPGADSSLEQIRRLQGEADQEPGLIAMILTDADAAEATALAGTAPSRLIVTADPHRSTTSAFGVHIWPTMITIDEAGIIASVTTGLQPASEQRPAQA